MNELLDNDLFRDAIKSVRYGRKTIVLGEGSLLFLLVAPVATSVTVVDSNPHFREILRRSCPTCVNLHFSRYVSYYKFHNVNVVESTTDVSADNDVVVGEPFYLSAMTPWQNLRFWYDLKSLREHLKKDIEVHPQTATLYGICERFDNLQNIAAPVGQVHGFDLSSFDDLSQKARQAVEAVVDIHSLWEYSGVTTSEKFEVLRFDLQEEPHDLNANFEILSTSGTNGVPLWMEWHIGNYTVTTGLKHEPRIGETPEWKEGVRQGVYLLSPSLLQKSNIRIDAHFDRRVGEVLFQFY
ncbi:hypothetical protein NECAME_09396 [Necator americanus]|uniref:Uncharacterized protein n=1 Tax=Necator americanus TaxID=51031 RepID=W2TEU8_NECAM|nr:hypothetical protein NECAME_09396 [Necator americanus]ETN80124.1 hypothetical protein NECAME_09396 [Necator americanus]